MLAEFSTSALLFDAYGATMTNMICSVFTGSLQSCTSNNLSAQSLGLLALLRFKPIIRKKAGGKRLRIGITI